MLYDHGDIMEDSDKTKEELIEELGRLRRETGSGTPPLKDDVPECGRDEEWQVVMDMLGDFLFVLDAKGSIIKTNPVVSKKLGFSQEDLLSMNIFDLYHPERGAEAEEIYSQIMVGEKYLCEIPFRTSDGSAVPVETKVAPGKWHGMDVIISISRDVSAGKTVEYELRVAFEKMKSILSSVPAYIWSAIIDSTGRFSYIYQSPAVIGITGRLPGYFMPGMDLWFGIVHQDERERVMSLYRKLISGEIAAGEDIYRVLHSDGETRWVRDNVLARKLGDNRVRLDGVITDITERLRAMEALEKSEGRLKGILSSMVDMVFAFDRDTRFTFFHTQDRGSLYVAPDKFAGKKHSDVMPPEIDILFSDAFEKNRAGKAAEFEYWLDVDGIRKCYSTKLAPIIKEGEFDGAVAVVRDITQHKTLQDALIMSERRYRELFNNIHDGSFWIDMEGRLIDFNQPFQELLGYEREDLYRLTVWDITPAELHDAEKKIIENEVITRGYSDFYRKEYLNKEGARIPVEVRRYLIRDLDGKPEGMWVIVRKTGPA
jgi:PAS domain S-box-containing protein